ncbi:MAG TPA: hypothetical protein DF613_14715 [Lachnospiraceae bacterium]|nr:hypothetical protein [Lachnospiraceae bacterium]
MNKRRTVVWHTPDISADGLKNFACIMMLMQTIGIAVLENGLIHIDAYTQESLSLAMGEDSRLMMLAGIASVLQLLGGMAVPIFSFLLVEGFLRTSNYKCYFIRLLAFAVLSEAVYDLAVYGKLWDLSGQNALFSMAVSLLMLYFLRMVQEKKGAAGILLRLLIVGSGVFWVSLLRANCGLCVVLLTAVFYLLYGKNTWKTILGILISLLYVTGPLAFYGIWCYNEVRKNKIPGYAYYLFYPLHLLLLGGISVIL